MESLRPRILYGTAGERSKRCSNCDVRTRVSPFLSVLSFSFLLSFCCCAAAVRESEKWPKECERTGKSLDIHCIRWMGGGCVHTYGPGSFFFSSQMANDLNRTHTHILILIPNHKLIESKRDPWCGFSFIIT